MITSIVAMIAAFLIAIPQPLEHPLACVADAQNTRLYVWLNYGAGNEYLINDDEWYNLTQLTGVDIWIGYDNGGWDIPEGVGLFGLFKIKGDIDGEPIEVWFWGTNTRYEYYVFSFDNTEQFADSNGEHYGIHPCGGWYVESRALEHIARRIVEDRRSNNRRNANVR